MNSIRRVNKLIREPYGQKVTISIIGAGGTGSAIITTLARFAYAYKAIKRCEIEVKVFDFDRVSESNVARQNFCVADIGLNKAAVLCTAINRRYGYRWKAYPYDYRKVEDDEVRANIIISCVDTAKARIDLAKRIKKWELGDDHPKMNAYWIDLGNTRTTAQIVMGGDGREIFEGNNYKNSLPHIPYITDMFDMAKYESADTTPACSIPEALEQQHIMINRFSADIACSLLWDLLTKEWIDWYGAFVNLENLNIKKLKFHVNLATPIIGNPPGAEKKTDRQRSGRTENTAKHKAAKTTAGSRKRNKAVKSNKQKAAGTR